MNVERLGENKIHYKKINCREYQDEKKYSNISLYLFVTENPIVHFVLNVNMQYGYFSICTLELSFRDNLKYLCTTITCCLAQLKRIVCRFTFAVTVSNPPNLVAVCGNWVEMITYRVERMGTELGYVGWDVNDVVFVYVPMPLSGRQPPYRSDG